MAAEPRQADKNTRPDNVVRTVRTALAIVFGIFLVVGLLVWLNSMLSWYLDPNSSLSIADRKDLAQGIGSVGQALAIGLTGIAGLIGLGFTWRNQRHTQRSTEQTLWLTEQGQITERFTRAINQLGATDEKSGKKKLEIRLGGIYALEQIARDSSERHHWQKYYWPVTAVLAAYVRQHTPQKDKEHLSKEGYLPLSRRLPDVHTILNVLGRRPLYYGEGERFRIDFRNTDLREADINAEVHFEGANFDGVNLEKASLRRAYLKEALFRQTSLEGANLEGANLQEADLQEADLRGANLHKANFQGASFFGTELEKTQFAAANLAGAQFGNCNLKAAVFESCNLQEAHFGQNILTDVYFRRTDLRSARFVDLDLQGSRFVGCNLQEASFPMANLAKAKFRQTAATLPGAKLLGNVMVYEPGDKTEQGADLRGVNFQQAILREVDLRQADLTRVNLEGTYLEGADLRGANLQEARLTQEQLEQANGDETTKLPEGLVMPKSWTKGEGKRTKESE